MIATLLARHRRHPLVRALASRARQWVEAFENRNYDPHANGELALLDRVAAHADVRTIFDGGANVGAWTQAAAQRFPRAGIHAFEIVPETYAQLRANCASLDRVVLNQVGLADAPGEIEVFYDPRMSALASCVPGFAEDFHGYQPRRERVAVTTGAEYAAGHSVAAIDLLKIDVEGFENRVLAGFLPLLRAGAVRVVQFEYGYVNIAARFLLRDFYDFFKPLGMRVGKIYPTHVEFREYRYEHEDFLGPNYVAVLASDQALLAALAG
jgi:FkbM family methyltransferase